MSIKKILHQLSLTALFLGSTTLIQAAEEQKKVVIIAVGDIIVPFLLSSTSSVEDVYLKAINEARSQAQDCGSFGVMPAVPPLKWNKKLEKASKLHSNDMAKSNHFNHTGSGGVNDVVAQALHPGTGSEFYERAEYSSYINYRALGENIAAGYETLDGVMTGWLKSDGHCKNLMNPAFEEIGMAKTDDIDSDYIHYWTQDFGVR